jgi:hypothetical protein
MSSFTRQALKLEGFNGFLTFDELRGRMTDVPASGGVYVVLRTSRSYLAGRRPVMRGKVGRGGSSEIV